MIDTPDTSTNVQHWERATEHCVLNLASYEAATEARTKVQKALGKKDSFQIKIRLRSSGLFDLVVQRKLNEPRAQAANSTEVSTPAKTEPTAPKAPEVELVTGTGPAQQELPLSPKAPYKKAKKAKG